jgi:hypothetical protein
LRQINRDVFCAGFSIPAAAKARTTKAIRSARWSARVLDVSLCRT